MTDTDPTPPVKLSISMSVIAAIGISACGVLVSWGANANRIQELEQATAAQRQELERTNMEVAGLDKAIAVQGAQYVEIIRRLDRIEKLEQQQSQ